MTPRRAFAALRTSLCGGAPRRCPACDRPLPPESAACPYCDEPLSAGRARAAWRAAALGAAAAFGAAAIVRAWPLLPPALPTTLAQGMLLAGGVAVLLTPFVWHGIPPPTRRGRLLALLRRLGHLYGAALAAALLLHTLRSLGDVGDVPLVVAALVATAAAAALASRAARIGFAAGLLLGLA